MYVKDRQIVENLRVKANNCYISLNEFTLSDLKDSVLSRNVCTSVLRNIIFQEIANFDELINFLKRILIYQVKILEREQQLIEKDLQVDLLEQEIAELLPKLVVMESNGGLFDEELKIQIDQKTAEANNLKQEVASERTIIENMKSAFTSYRVPDGVTQLSYGTPLYSVIEIDTTTLESVRSYVKYVANKFKVEAYDPYVNSDLTEYFEGYIYQVDEAYNRVLDCLNRIYKAIDSYINECLAIEYALSGHMRKGNIENSVVATILAHLPDLESYSLTFANTISLATHNLQKEKKVSLDEKTKENQDRELEESIEASGGLGSREAVVAVATQLSEKSDVPYFYGGKSKNKGFNNDWGSDQRIMVDGSEDQPKGSIAPYGLDAIGFIEWALNNGGFNTHFAEDKLDDELGQLGDVLKYNVTNLNKEVVKAGDLLYKDRNHLAIITDIDHDEKNIKVAEERSAKDGMVVIETSIANFVDENDFNSIILMEKYYEKYNDEKR